MDIKDVPSYNFSKTKIYKTYKILMHQIVSIAPDLTLVDACDPDKKPWFLIHWVLPANDIRVAHDIMVDPRKVPSLRPDIDMLMITDGEIWYPVRLASEFFATPIKYAISADPPLYLPPAIQIVKKFMARAVEQYSE